MPQQPAIKISWSVLSEHRKVDLALSQVETRIEGGLEVARSCWRRERPARPLAPTIRIFCASILYGKVTTNTRKRDRISMNKESVAVSEDFDTSELLFCIHSTVTEDSGFYSDVSLIPLNSGSVRRLWP